MKIPLPVTLRKYGMTELDYTERFNAQEGVCAICKKPPKEGRTLNIDHVHVRGWKKMRPDQRKQFVRGLACYFCNRFYMAKNMTEAKAFNIIEYIQAYEGRNR
jgi:hypothetical protein